MNNYNGANYPLCLILNDCFVGNLMKLIFGKLNLRSEMNEKTFSLELIGEKMIASPRNNAAVKIAINVYILLRLSSYIEIHMKSVGRCGTGRRM